jgi:hypothetical protein
VKNEELNEENPPGDFQKFIINLKVPEKGDFFL